MRRMNRFTAIVMLAATTVIGAAACNTKEDVKQVASVQKTDSLKVNFSGTANFAFFNFKNGTVVPVSDSATGNWDFALRFTTFLVNSNASGPGNAGVILQNNIYSNVTSAPATGYAYDTTSAKKAIKDGSWYDYNPATRTFSPKAGQTFVFRTADGKYVKMELLAVDYEAFTGPTPTKLIYRFRYTYQPSGGTNF